MNELFQSLQEHVPSASPFMMAAGAVLPQKLDKNRVVESVITAVVSGGVIAAAGYFLALPVLEEKVKAATAQMVEIKADVKEVKAEVRSVSERQQRLEGRLEGERRYPARGDRQ